ncbi:MAG: S1C family serine protease [Candidatus Dormibacteria bacterium]
MTDLRNPDAAGNDPARPTVPGPMGMASHSSFATPWTVHEGDVPPPPPPPAYAWTPSATAWPPVHPGRQYSTTPVARTRSRWAAAATGLAVLALAFGGGYLADRLSSSPTSSSTAGIGVLVPAGGLPVGGGGSASSAGGSADTAGVAAKVTPGIVNVNVTLAGGTAAGTGMIITSTGEVLTNNHVIDGETSVSVTLPSTARTYAAHVLGWDPVDDVALLQIDGGGTFTTVHVGTSSSVTVGETVVALGNALGKNGQPTVTSGVVTSLDQSITASDSGGGNAETISGLIEITAPIQPGDSGGPLTNTDGTVIGMDTAAQVSSDRFNTGNSSVAYAIPIDSALTVVRQIQSGAASTAVHIGTTRALMGVGGRDGANGVQVVTVEPGSGAARAGITVGSTITAIDGQAVSSNTTLRNDILIHKPGDTVSVTWLDPAGTPHTASVTLMSGPPA